VNILSFLKVVWPQIFGLAFFEYFKIWPNFGLFFMRHHISEFQHSNTQFNIPNPGNRNSERRI